MLLYSVKTEMQIAYTNHVWKILFTIQNILKFVKLQFLTVCL